MRRNWFIILGLCLVAFVTAILIQYIQIVNEREEAQGKFALTYADQEEVWVYTVDIKGMEPQEITVLQAGMETRYTGVDAALVLPKFAKMEIPAEARVTIVGSEAATGTYTGADIMARGRVYLVYAVNGEDLLGDDAGPLMAVDTAAQDGSGNLPAISRVFITP